MDPTAADTIRQLVSALQGVLPALQEATASQPATTTVPTAFQPATAADSTAAARPPPNPEVAYLSGTMATPSSYSGSAEDCSDFLLQCQLAMEMQPHCFPTDRAKFAFIISLLTGKALRWADSLWQQNSPVLQSVDAFVSLQRGLWQTLMGYECGRATLPPETRIQQCSRSPSPSGGRG
ncbi:uncharacterized protein LOC131356711 isoform X3 [Hemibagrus wyckioides]|uniref:uncharacterized protein LOC131356711 isoform X3 n=1 Tax=Hemibagrus wyckioides TaxID=337641 RepID=UPI00266D217F|nr:uncharacterized protein LOC131356711 isoform X3 [Hemibagrus wyckioides]